MTIYGWHREYTGRRNTVDVNAGFLDDADVIRTPDRELVEHLSQVFCALSKHRKRMRGRIVVARETVVAVGDAVNARPHFVSEEVHVLDVPGSVRRHAFTETSNNIDIIIIINNIIFITSFHQSRSERVPVKRSAKVQYNYTMQLQHKNFLLYCSCIALVRTAAIQRCNTSFLQLAENLHATCNSGKTRIAVVLRLCVLLQYTTKFLCYFLVVVL